MLFGAGDPPGDTTMTPQLLAGLEGSVWSLGDTMGGKLEMGKHG